MLIHHQSRLLCLALFLFSTTVFAQKKVETFYFNSRGDTVQTKGEASYYRVVQTNGKNRITTKYDSIDVKLEETAYRKDKSQTTVGDSVWWLHGSFREWFPSGQLKVEGSRAYDRLHDNLKTYYPNGVLRRNDVYYLDTLKSGHCYAQDSSEIAHFPYQVNPEFVGGQKAMFEFLAENIRYPSDSRRRGTEGTVYVGFVINKTGEVADIKVKKGVDNLLNKEALRVVKLMPNWKAGRQDGDLVRVAYTLPIKFRLD